jgi:hypothetical protein
LTAWLVAHNKGPHKITPETMTGQRPRKEAPAETMPQQNAHIGGNQVMGFSSSSTTAGDGWSGIKTEEAGRDIDVLRRLFELFAFGRGEFSESIAP